MPFNVQRTVNLQNPVFFNNNTSSTINTWTLALPANNKRQKWVLTNKGSDSIEVGLGDGLGNVTSLAVVAANSYKGEQDNVTAGDIFVRSATASQPFNLIEY